MSTWIVLPKRQIVLDPSQIFMIEWMPGESLLLKVHLRGMSDPIALVPPDTSILLRELKIDRQRLVGNEPRLRVA